MSDLLTLGFDAKRAFLNPTGLGNYSRFVLRTLAARFPEHCYVLYTPRARGHLPPPLLTVGPHAEVRTAPSTWPTELGRALWRTFALGRRAAQDGVSLFHGLSQQLPRDLPRSVAAVVTMHDALPARFPEFYPAVDRRLYIWKARWSCGRADRVVAVSEQTRRDLCDLLGVDPAKVRVVHQGCDTRFRQSLPAEALEAVRARYGLPAEYVLSVGTVERRKNQLVLLRALEVLAPQARPYLVLVGRPTAYRRQLEAFARRAGLAGGWRILHPVPPDDLPALYQGARVFAYPSLFEGFGIPILEALSSGVPVITSTGSCFGEVGGPAARYVPPDEPEAFAEAIHSVLSDAELARRMVEAGRRQARSFDDARLAEALMAVYTEALCDT